MCLQLNYPSLRPNQALNFRQINHMLEHTCAAISQLSTIEA